MVHRDKAARPAMHIVSMGTYLIFLFFNRTYIILKSEYHLKSYQNHDIWT